MAFSDSIETDLLATVYFTRESQAQNSRGDYVTAAATVAHTVKGDLQAATTSLWLSGAQGADYRITHRLFCDVPSSVPAEDDHCVDGSTEYAVRNVRNWATHLELDMERLGL